MPVLELLFSGCNLIASINFFLWACYVVPPINSVSWRRSVLKLFIYNKYWRLLWLQSSIITILLLLNPDELLNPPTNDQTFHLTSASSQKPVPITTFQSTTTSFHRTLQFTLWLVAKLWNLLRLWSRMFTLEKNSAEFSFRYEKFCRAILCVRIRKKKRKFVLLEIKLCKKLLLMTFNFLFNQPM